MALSDLTPKEKKEVLSLFDSRVAEGQGHCAPKHDRWSQNSNYVSGISQWSPGDKARQARRKRPIPPLSDVFRVTHAIANREMVERYSPKLQGRETNDGGISNVGDELCRWQRQTSNSEHYESMAFRSAIMCGYGVAQKFYDPTAADGRGLIVDRDVPLNEMLWSSRAREMNLLDRRWHICGRWVGIDTAESLYGSSSPALRRKFRELRKEKEIARRVGNYPEDGATGTSPRRANYGFGWSSLTASGWVNGSKTELFVAEMEWKEIEYIWRPKIPVRFWEWYSFMVGSQPITFEQEPLEDGTPQEPFVLTREQYDAMTPEQQAEVMAAVLTPAEEVVIETRKELNEFLDAWLRAMGSEFTRTNEGSRTVVKYAIKIDDELADYGTRPWGWSYHFITCFPFETEEGMEFVGAVDIVKGAQDMKNAIVSAMIANYQSNPKGGLAISKSAGVAEKIADMWARPDGITQLPDAVMQNLDQHVKHFPISQFPTIGSDLLRLFSDSVMTQLGMDSISTGAQTDLRRVSGVVVQSAQAAANVIVAIPFDAMRLFRRQYGLCNIRFLHYVYDSEDIIRIVGEDKAEDMQALMTESWDDILLMDVVIDEAPSTPTEQMEQVQALTATGTVNMLLERGDLSLEAFVKHFLPALSETAKRDILEGKRMIDQLNMVQQENEQLKQQMGAAAGQPAAPPQEMPVQ